MSAASRQLLPAVGLVVAAIALAAGIVAWHDARLARALEGEQLRELRAAHRAVER